MSAAKQNSTLRGVLTEMKERCRNFKKLMGECFRRNHEDGVREGWLTAGDIARFEDDMEKLIEKALGQDGD